MIINNFFIKKHILSRFTVYFQYFYTIKQSFYLKLRYFKLKIDPKMCTFKNLEEISQK